jgi:hypothetical protein
VEIEEHGNAIRGQQDVGWLQIQMEQSPIVRILKGIGQTGPDPADDIGERRGLKGTPNQTVRRWTGFPGSISMESREKIATGNRLSSRPDSGQHIAEGCSSEVRQTQAPKTVRWELVNGIQGDDVRVLESCQ